jgi:hypothetical protein
MRSLRKRALGERSFPATFIIPTARVAIEWVIIIQLFVAYRPLIVLPSIGLGLSAFDSHVRGPLLESLLLRFLALRIGLRGLNLAEDLFLYF